MANGQRQRGGAGVKRSSTLDIIEQLARIGGGMAAASRARKQKKSNVLQGAIGRIIGKGGENYKSLYLPETDAQIGRIKDSLMQYGDRVKNSDLETRELYKYALEDIGRHEVQNEDYRAKKTMLEGYYGDMQSSIDTYYKSQSTVGSEGNEEAYKKMKTLSEDYINLYNEMFSLHGDRIKNDAGVVSTFKAMDVASKFAMEQYISGDFRTDPREYEAMKTSLMIKDVKPIETYKQEFASSQDMKRRAYYQQYERNRDTIEGLKEGIEESFRYGETLLDPSQYLSSDKGEEYLQAILVKKLKDRSLENELGNDLRIWSGDDEMTWAKVAEYDVESLVSMYTDIYNDNTYVKKMRDLEEDQRSINSSYGDVNMGEKLIPDELLVVGQEEKALPSVQLVDQINSHIKNQKSYSFLGEYETNNINELQTLAQEAYKNSVNKYGEEHATTKNIEDAWKRLLNTVNNQLMGSKEAVAGKFSDIESFYNGQIKFNLKLEQ